METIVRYKIAQTEAEWHELRSKGLGGSDIGTVLGFNPYKSPYQLWLEKTGVLVPEDISDKVAIQIGNELEDLVARMFTQETGLKVQKDNKTYFHQKHPFLLANIDRKIIGEKTLLECKTTSAYNEGNWDGDEVPASYLLQVQHYLNVLDYDKAYIAVLIGNHKFLWKEIKRDDDLIAAYTEQAAKFWQENIRKFIPPEIDGSTATKEAIDQLYSDVTERETALPKAQIELIDSLTDIKRDLKTLESMKTEKENQLKNFLGQEDAQVAISEEYKVTWRNQTQRRVDSKRLKEEQAELYEDYSKETSFKKLLIKELG